ncbi:hypothetical protein V6Z11_1Z030800 [Gossypium hirsutum]
MANRSCLLYAFLLLVALQSSMIMANTVIHTPQCRPVAASSKDKILFSMNLLIYKAEFFLRASVGVGINGISPGLVQGPVPIGATLANITNSARRVIEELGLATVGHLRAIVNVTLLRAPLPRPQLNFTAGVFANILNLSALTPPFNVYGGQTQFFLVAEPLTSLIQYYLAQVIPSIAGIPQQQLVTGIGLNAAAQHGYFRTRLNAIVNITVPPYTITVASFTNTTATAVNLLDCAPRTELPPTSYRVMSIPYHPDRTERETLRILHGTGNATRPGGIFPSGPNGTLYRLVIVPLRLS